jgi:uncharacterized protein YjbI with pentapeptide repeats
MMLQSKSVGNKIAAARKNANLSQADLAFQISISPQAVGKWERGESMPDISTLNRLAELLGVDLNYFSDNFQSTKHTTENREDSHTQISEMPNDKQKKRTQWDMSEGNWENMDFSGLKNIQEKFSSSNIRNTRFIDSDLTGLLLRNNNFESCDFTRSNFSNNLIQKSNLSNNKFKSSSLNGSQFNGSFITGCDFTDADFTEVAVKFGGFERNIVTNVKWKHSSFTEAAIINVVFEGLMEDCYFEKCGFSKVTFQNAQLINTFFKYNNLKRVKFINCQADRLTYGLLKHGKADLKGISLITE